MKIKVLWIVNTIFPYPAEKLGLSKTIFGGWLNSLAEQLKEDKQLSFAIATIYNGDEIMELNDGKIQYYLIPGTQKGIHNKRIEKYWKEIKERFQPDLVHIHGTEYSYGLAFVKANPEVKNIISIQGLAGNIAKVYYSNIPIIDIIKNITLRDIVKRDSIIQQKRKFIKKGKKEMELLKKARFVIGRTTWDYANVMAINPKLKYFEGQETLRKSFYQKKWNIDKVDKYTLFCSQAYYTIKGLHFVIEAINILKIKYPNIKLYVAGPNIFQSKLKLTGYGNYIKKMIEKYQLKNNIEFIGLLNEEQMVERLLKTHVFLLPSAIENSSNSLGEAMLLGMPCVATNTGGTVDMLQHKRDGFSYSYTEPAVLAEYVSQFFENEELCLQYGENAREKALKRHNPQKNAEQIMTVYKEVLGIKEC